MANEYLKRTPTSTGNRSVYTWAGWVKINEINLDKYLFSSGDDASNIFYITLRRDSNNNNFTIVFRDGDTTSHSLVFDDNSYRDPSSWIHLVVAVDTTITTPTQDRVKVYINGKRLINPTTDQLGNLNANSQTSTNALELHTIGDYSVTSGTYAKTQIFDCYLVDGQALTPDVFGYHKDGAGYISVGSAQATSFKRGQWVPKKPSAIKAAINAEGGFGVNGFYLPINDGSNMGADFHCEPNSIITLKGENNPQPRNGAPTTSDAYVSQLRADPYAANLVLAVPGISTATGINQVVNGNFDNGTTSWTASTGATLTNPEGTLRVTVTQTAGAEQTISGLTVGERYTLSFRLRTDGTNFANQRLTTNGVESYIGNRTNTIWEQVNYSFTATNSILVLYMYKATGGWVEYDDIVLKQEDAPLDYSADIKGSGTNRTPTATGPAGVGYEIPSYYGSAINTTGANDALYYDVDGSGSNAYGTDDFTFECWFYATEEPSNWGILLKHATNGSWNNGITLTSKYNTDRKFTIYTQDGSSNVQTIGGTVWALNQWHHVVAERYNGQLTLYVNGVAEATRADTRNYAVAGTPASSAQNALSIGAQNDGNYQSNGYFQDVRVYKGVAKYKGGFDVPKPYTPVGIATWRAVSDCTANNFATLNSLAGSGTLTDGNLTFTAGGIQSKNSTFATTGNGKWYVEFRTGNVQSGTWEVLGIHPINKSAGPDRAYAANGQFWNGSAWINFGTAWNNGDIIGIAYNQDDNEISFYLNGTLQSSTQSYSSSESHYFVVRGNSGSIFNCNFGQNPTFSGTLTAGTFTDNNGKGLFKYQPPTGFLALCEDNLPTPAIANPGEHFKTVLYTGDGTSGTTSIKGFGFKPDLIWLKGRSSTGNHGVWDSVRGATNRLTPNLTDAESISNGVVSFDDDGFSRGIPFSASGSAYVAWGWKAGGAAVSNTDGTITSQVSVNQDAGFSIASYTGNGSTGTIGHGLGKTPSFVIVKGRTNISQWLIWHNSLTGSQFLEFNSNAVDSAIGAWNDTLPNSTTISLGSSPAASSDFIAYCWTEIESFSKFGSYVGNGSADGPFVYCGFKPAWVMVKNADDTGGRDWGIQDSSRASSNPCNKQLKPNQSEVENSGLADSTFQIDMLSNGFKVRNNTGIWNNSGETIIFAAFAESPFQTANAK